MAEIETIFDDKFFESNRKNLEFIGNILKEDESLVVVNPEAGEISIDKGNIGKSGNGLQHIIEQRFEKDNRSIEELAAILSLVMMSAAEGKISRDVKVFQNNIDIGTLDLEKNGIIAFVSKTRDGYDEKFVITGFDDRENKKQADDAIKAVIANYNYTPEFVIVKKQVGATLVSSYNLHLKDLEVNQNKLQTINFKNLNQKKQLETKIKKIKETLEVYNTSKEFGVEFLYDDSNIEYQEEQERQKPSLVINSVTDFKKELVVQKNQYPDKSFLDIAKKLCFGFQNSKVKDEVNELIRDIITKNTGTREEFITGKQVTEALISIYKDEINKTKKKSRNDDYGMER